jgi:phage FluMu protein Com
MKTLTCPRCTEVLAVIDNQDYIVCSRCGNTLFISNFTLDEAHDRKDEDTDGASE